MMTYDLSSIKLAMGSWLGIPSTDTRRLPDDVREDIINELSDDLAKRRDWPFLVTQMATATLAAGQYQVTLPANFARVYSVHFKDNAGNASFEPQAQLFEEWIATYPDPTDASTWGSPSNAALQGRTTLLIGPPPSAAGWTVVLWYYKFPATLTGAVTTNEITANLGRVLRLYAVAEAADFIMEPDRAQAFRAKADAALATEDIDQTDAQRLNQRPMLEEP